MEQSNMLTLIGGINIHSFIMRPEEMKCIVNVEPLVNLYFGQIGAIENTIQCARANASIPARI
ncbi:hypothetical protein K3495_g1362 [Podosphaera aphanis]|nr:hypothetical protein K3495_g1362 [Podosphaera aphanis]